MPLTQNRKFLSYSYRLIICATLLLCTLTLTALCFVHGRTNGLLVSELDRPISVVANAPQDQVSNDVNETEVLTIRPTGFEPAAITRPPGEFLLVINNRSGLEEVNWSLDRETGGKVRELKISGGKLRSGNFQDLPPGRYVLTEANHPEWICRITITSQ